MPVWEEVYGETRHKFVHSTLKIEKDSADVEYSKITGFIVKTVRNIFNNIESWLCVGGR